MLYVHRSERADLLVKELAQLLDDPLTDPLVSEVVAVPTRGIERWLTQSLSHTLGAATGEGGVCANVEFPFPGTLVAELTAAVSGIDRQQDPWAPARAVWPLIEVVDACIEEDFLHPLSAHLRESAPAGSGVRRYSTLRHLADLYDRYAVHRPSMLLGWLAGEGSSWQAELWRRLRERIGVPSLAERLDKAALALVRRPELSDLPPRLSLFGLTRMPVSHFQVLKAVAEHRDLHLFLLHPSAVLWNKVAAAVAATRGSAAVMRRSDDYTAQLPDHPLLRSWARDSREMQLVIGSVAGGHLPVPEQRKTLLGLIQSDIRADRAPPGRPAEVFSGGHDGGAAPAGPSNQRAVIGVDDDSLRVHSCHGRARQVEVLRDAILHLLAADATLELRDILVMCPDIEAFAPLIRAAFEPPHDIAGVADGLPLLRVRLADRSLRQTNPLLGVAAHLLELASGRVRASEVIDFASREPVRKRFELVDEDLDDLQRWVTSAGVRWGIDGRHRARWRLDGLDDNTWLAGLERLLLGVALEERELQLFGGVLPARTQASRAELLGQLAELVSRLAAAVGRLSIRQTLSAWIASIVSATESLAASGVGEDWQADELQRVLFGVLDEACDGGERVGPLLDLAEVRALLGERLQGRPTRANFRTGDLTFCTMVPMRSVPHRVICLLGLDEDAYPRKPEIDGDDLLRAEPVVADRDARSEDRQLLLDALLAAREHLLITYSSLPTAGETSVPIVCPPAVPVSELLDVVDRTARLEDGGSVLPAVVVEHPLQPYDPRNFTPDSLPGVVGPWGFDAANLAGAVAISGERREAWPFLDHLLQPLPGPAVELADLVSFAKHPVRTFLRKRLATTGWDSELAKDTMPVELAPLEQWSLGERLLDACMRGVPLDRAWSAEIGRGTLPPDCLAEPVRCEVLPHVEALVQYVESLQCVGAPEVSMEVNVGLPDGRMLVGAVAGVRGATIVSSTYSRLSYKHRLAVWTNFLALQLAHPELAVEAVTVGRSARGSAGARSNSAANASGR